MDNKEVKLIVSAPEPNYDKYHRALFANDAQAAILYARYKHDNTYYMKEANPEDVAKLAVQHADALMKVLNET